MNDILRHYLKIIIIGFVAAFILGAGITFGLMWDGSSKEPDPLTIDYVKYYGFKEIDGGGLIYQINQDIIPNTRDTIASYVAIIPNNKDNPQFFVIGMADLIRGQGYRFIRVDVIDKREQFDRWIEFLQLDNR